MEWDGISVEWDCISVEWDGISEESMVLVGRRWYKY